MPLRSPNRRRFEVVAGGHPGSCGRVAVLNDHNVAQGQTDTFGHKQSIATPVWWLLPGSRHQCMEAFGLSVDAVLSLMPLDFYRPVRTQSPTNN